MKTTMRRSINSIIFLLLIIDAINGQTQGINPTRGLIAYFPFNENANDEAGINNGTLHGPNLTDERCGNHAYYFDGEDDYIDCGNDISINGAFAGLTISAWIKPDIIVEKEYGTIVSKWGFDPYKDHFGLWVNENYKVVMAVGDSRTMENGLFSHTILEPDVWYHVVATWNRKREIKIFIDGQLDGFSTQTGNGLNTRSKVSLKIGRQVVRKNRPFRGHIDEVRIYDRAISDQEIETLYNNGKSECERIYLAGNVYNKTTGKPLNAEIILDDLTSGNPYTTIKSSGNDAYYEITLPVGFNFGLFPSLTGYIPINENIDTREMTPNSSYFRDLYLVPVEVGESLTLNNVFFDFAKASLRKESHPALNRLLELFALYPELKVEISGHTDWVGGDDFNKKLSGDRAKSVKDYLVANKIASVQIRTIGYGEEKPVATNETDEGRQLNRRVEFKILEK